MGDMDPSSAAAKALGEEPDREAAEGRQTSERSTDETSRESSRESSRTSGLRSMLSSTEPEVSPQQARGSFDLSTPWYAHLEAGIEKASNAHGTPAWVHLTVAFLLLLSAELDLSIPTGGDESGDGDDLEDEGDGAAVDGGVHSI
ncbi:hypothetical protein [Natronomonas gomsonensis]|uniref:hypothetical protein n=1 Tax=Natronomonas gomsonensis TaxID=1046043 RepID=UPI0015BE3E1E|nr:hypothetical protein [Natronomonas gomsonensis]